VLSIRTTLLAGVSVVAALGTLAAADGPAVSGQESRRDGLQPPALSNRAGSDAPDRASRAGGQTRDVRTVAAAIAEQQHSWGVAQFDCLDELWGRESGWRPTATNDDSGAYGIPQALPGSKMRAAGADWRTNAVTQIEWGMSYIDARHGSPCGALDAYETRGWY